MKISPWLPILFGVQIAGQSPNQLNSFLGCYRDDKNRDLKLKGPQRKEEEKISKTAGTSPKNREQNSLDSKMGGNATPATNLKQQNCIMRSVGISVREEVNGCVEMKSIKHTVEVDGQTQFIQRSPFLHYSQSRLANRCKLFRPMDQIACMDN